MEVENFTLHVGSRSRKKMGKKDVGLNLFGRAIPLNQLLFEFNHVLNH
jgi:hypothetical protein